MQHRTVPNTNKKEEERALAERSSVVWEGKTGAIQGSEHQQGCDLIEGEKNTVSGFPGTRGEQKAAKGEKKGRGDKRLPEKNEGKKRGGIVGGKTKLGLLGDDHALPYKGKEVVT